jgi:hypothetical protein
MVAISSSGYILILMRVKTLALHRPGANVKLRWSVRGAGSIFGRLSAALRVGAVVALGICALAACWTCRERQGQVPDRKSFGSAPADAPAGAPAWDWNGVIGTGQSLAVGAGARQATMTTQRFRNLKLSLGATDVEGPPYDSNAAGLSVVPLVEPIRPEVTSYPGAYPFNIYGETPHTAMADQISALYAHDGRGDYVTVHTVVGESGQGIHVIDKGALVTPSTGHAYAAALFEASALVRLASAAGKSYGVAAIVLTHGETDGRNDDYESDVTRLLADLNRDIQIITGQKTKILLLLTQQQTRPGDNSKASSLLAQWKIGVDHEGDVVCVGPKYQYPYASDRLHLVASGYDQIGEKYAEVYYERVVLGQLWRPLEPVAAVLRGRIITVRFHVPVPPLVWDENMPAPHQAAHSAWSRGRGFEVSNRQGEETIDSVAILNDSVLITLGQAPAATGLVVRYAVTQDGEGSLGGLASGRIGQLRDSDPLVGYDTTSPQYNYALSFEVPVVESDSPRRSP